jgi:hypothetical protein
MRIGVLFLLLCLASGGCATSQGRCQGPLQPINPPQSKAQSKAATSTVDPGASVP